VAYGESTALIAGDALQALAFESLAQPSAVSAGIRLQMLAVLAKAAGPAGLAGGQFLDMTLAGSRPSLEQIAEMQRLKTGALIEASVVLGAMASGAALEANRFEALRSAERFKCATTFWMWSAIGLPCGKRFTRTSMLTSQPPFLRWDWKRHGITPGNFCRGR
jgi:hypothetical protein